MSKKDIPFNRQAFGSIADTLRAFEDSSEEHGEMLACVKAHSLVKICLQWTRQLHVSSPHRKALEEILRGVGEYAMFHMDLMDKVKEANIEVERIQDEAKEMVAALLEQAAKEEERKKRTNEHDPDLH